MSLCILSGLSLEITSKYSKFIIESEILKNEVSKDEPILAVQDDKKGVQFRHTVEVITITPNRSASTSTETGGENNVGDAGIEGDVSIEPGINNEEPKISHPLESIDIQEVGCSTTIIKQPKLVKYMFPRYYEALK